MIDAGEDREPRSPRASLSRCTVSPYPNELGLTITGTTIFGAVGFALR
jgi:hypothetical protein